MPTPAKGARLGGGPAHERLMLANLATALFENGKITTTEAKAKRLRPLAERLITFAKRGDLHARRRVMTVVRDKSVVHELFSEIGPRYEHRNGGYTRVTKIGPRKGDNAPMAVIELVEALTVKAETVREAEAATERAAKKAPAKKAATKKAAAGQAEQPAAAEADEQPGAAESDQVEESASTDEAPYGEGSHASLEDGSMPDGFPVKGNTNSMKYHTPESPAYERTTAEVWFASPEAAEAAGFEATAADSGAPSEDES